MPSDASIFQNAQPIQAASPADAMTKALTLSNMGMQNRQMQLQMQTQQAMRDSYSNNSNEDGSLDREGFLSDIGKVNPQAAIQMSQNFVAQDKARAEATSAKMDAAEKTYNITGPAFEYMAKLPEQERAKVYPNVIQQLKDQGVDVSRMDHPYDPGLFNQYYGNWQQTKGALANQLTQSEIGKNQMDPMKTGAEELGKFNEDINNASSRKTTGQLINARDRADRVLTLLNSGAQPGETQEQRIARLNKVMPQIGTEVGVSLASIMQGGVPDETLMKEVAPDTLNSRIADLRQKFSANPTAANQGALLDAYGDIAKKLRGFSADRLQQIGERARAAYPYANKYFPDKMDKISSPLAAPSSGPDDSNQTLASKSSGFGIPGVASANAAEKPMPSQNDAQALQWLKNADPSNPVTFKVRAKLKAKGLL